MKDTAHDKDECDYPNDIIRDNGHFRQRQNGDEQSGVFGEIAMPADLAFQCRIVTCSQIYPVADAVRTDQYHQNCLQNDEYGSGDGRDNRCGHWAIS